MEIINSAQSQSQLPRVHWKQKKKQRHFICSRVYVGRRSGFSEFNEIMEGDSQIKRTRAEETISLRLSTESSRLQGGKKQHLPRRQSCWRGQESSCEFYLCSFAFWVGVSTKVPGFLFLVVIWLSFSAGVGETEEIWPENLGVDKRSKHSKATFLGSRTKSSRNTQKASKSARGWLGPTELFYLGSTSETLECVWLLDVS